jgi:alcohol dehydrogenase
VGIPALKETSFNPADVAKLADQAMRDVCTGGNPKEVSKDDMVAIYLKAYNG